MIAKPLLALVASPFLLSAAPEEKRIYTEVPEVHQVFCNNGMVRGTAWRNGVGSLVTARHVTHGRDCYIEGEQVNVTWESEELDMAVIRTAKFGTPLKINCGGYIDRQAYAGVGYARGEPRQQVIFVLFGKDVDASLPRWLQFKTMFGDRFIPGQSGGPVYNSAGEVVGLVNGYSSVAPLSYSLQMKDTPLCA